MQRHKHYMGPSALRASALHGSMVPSSARGAAGERDFELKDARKRCKSVPSLRDLEEEYRRKRAEEIEKKKEIEEDMRYRQERMRQYQERAHQRTMTKEATWSRVTRDQHHRVQLERARGGFGRPFPAPRAPERKKSVSSDRVVELRRRIFELEDIVEKQSEELEIIIGAKAEVEFTPSPTRRRMRIQNLDGEQNVDTINSRSLVTDRPNKYAVDYSLLSLSLDDDDDRVDSSVTGQKSARSQDPFSNRSTSRVSTLDRSGSRVALCRTTTTHVDRSAGRQLMSSRSAKTSSTGHAGGGIKAPRGSSSSSSVSTTTSNVRSNTRTTSNNTGTSGTSNSSSSNNRSSANRRYWDNRSKCIKMPQPLSLQGSTTRGARAHDVRTVEPHHQDRSSSQSTISMLKTGGKSCRSLREQELQEFEHQERTIDRIMSTTTTRHSIKHDEEVTPRLPTLRPASEEKLSPVKTTRSFGTEEVSPLKRLNLTKEMDDEDESDVESEVESESADEKDDEENDELDSDSADADEVDEKDDEDKAAVRYKEGETLSDSERSERSDSDSNPSTPDEESAQDNWTSNAASYFADLASMSSAERREVINEQSGASQLDLHDKEYVSRELSMDNDEDVLSRAADFEIFIYLNNRLENGSLLKMHTRGVLEPIEEVEEELETTRRPLKRSYDSFKPRTRSCPASPYDEDVLEEAPRITRSPSKGGRDTRSREPGISSSSSPNELPIHSPPHSNSSNTQPATTIPGLVSVRSLGGKTSSSNANSSSKGTKKELALRLTPTTTTTTPTPTTTTTPRQDKRVDNNTPGTGTGARDRRRSVTQDEPDTMAEEQARKRECEIREEEKRRQQEREAETEEWRRRQELLESAKVEREKRIQRERVKERRRREQEALAGEQRRQESEQDARAIEDRSQEAYRKRKALENGINLRAVEDDENGGEQSEYDEEESVQGFVEEESEEGESEEEESEEGESEEGSEEGSEEESEEGESREDKEEFVEEEGSKELSEEEDEHHKKEVKQDGKHAPMEAPPLTGVLGECPSRSGAGKVELEANTSISVKQRALELEMCPISIPTKGGGTTTAISLPVSTSTTPTSKVKSLVAAWNSGNTPRACDDNNNAIESTKTTLPSEIPPTKFKVALAVQDWVRGVRKNNTQTDDEDDEEEDEEEKDGEEEEVPTTTKPIPATREHTQAQHNRAQSHNENSRGLSHMFARKTDMNTKTRKKSFHTEQMELVLKLQGRG